MFTKKSNFQIFSCLLILTFLLASIQPARAESNTRPLYASGDFLWTKVIGGTNYDSGNAITMDGDNNLYATGVFQGTVDFDPGTGTTNLTSAGYGDIFVSKLDANGNLAWAKRIGGNGEDVSICITLDSVGNVYIIGWFQNTADFDPGPGTVNLISAGYNDIFIVKLNNYGDLIWAKGVGGTGNDMGHSVTVDINDNIYITGAFQGTIDLDPGVGTFMLTSSGSTTTFLSKWDSNGIFTWAKNDIGMGGISGTALDASGNIYTIGADGSVGNENILLLKLDNNGTLLWFKFVAGAGNDRAFKIILDANDNIYMTGLFEGTVDFDPGAGVFELTSAGSTDIFVSKWDSSGNFIWAGSMGGADFDVGYSIALDTNGDIYVTGAFSGIADFDAGAGTFDLTSTGSTDIFVSKLDGNGNFVWASGMGAPGNDDVGQSNALDSNGNIYLTGDFNNDIFISKIENEVISEPKQFVVTKTTDTDDGVCDSDCSLREAIAVAPTGATIRFAPNLSGATINLSSTLILYRDVTIDGSALASKITISGDTENDGMGNVQVFLIFDSDVTSTLNSLSITKGANSTGGGGIYNYGNTTVTNCMFLDNSSGGIYNSSGTLTVTNSTFSGNSGGGIVSNNGTLLVTNSTFSGNSSAIGGGGILNYSTTTVVNSTFSDNSAEQGGGIYNGGTLVVTNSTFVGNSADTIGGGIYNNGPLTITNSTLSGNSAEQGSGVFNLDALNYANAIIANSISGGDCFNSGTIATNTNNLVEDDSCSPALSGDPKLGALADNGGATQTMALVDGSPAINAGNNVACPSTDQRGVARPKGIYCDIGSFEYVDNTPPSVDSITRVGAANVSASSVDFIVTFSEPVTGIKTTVPFEDFSLTTSPGISGASITNVSGSGTNYTVTVNTGSGVGTIRLDIPNTATIVDLFENPLANLPFTSGETYTITTGDVFSSIAANDGWALESSEYSSRANARSNSGHLLVGDNAKNRQYRSLLYFDTSSLPDNAVITSVTLKIMQAGVTGTDPFTTHGLLFAEMKNGFFGKSPLENTDFQATPNPKRSVGAFAPVSGEPDWYELVLNPANFKYVNLKGVTQFRIRFTKDDDNDKVADFVSFFSGDDPTNPPQLIVEYITP